MGAALLRPKHSGVKSPSAQGLRFQTSSPAAFFLGSEPIQEQAMIFDLPNPDNDEVHS
jgi:hypothetical protein